MKIGRVYRLFNDGELTEILSRVAEEETESGKQARKVISDFLTRNMKVNAKETLELEAAVNELVCMTGLVWLDASFVISEAFDIIDPEALKEIRELKKRMKDYGFLGYWSKENKAACARPGKAEAQTAR